MSIIGEKFRKVRFDQSPYLFHFTRGSLQDAKQSMYSILEQEKLVSEFGCIWVNSITGDRGGYVQEPSCLTFLCVGE